MKIDFMKKLLIAVAIGAVVSLGLVGCDKGGAKSAGDHPSKEKAHAEQASEEHPSKDAKDEAHAEHASEEHAAEDKASDEHPSKDGGSGAK